MSMPSRWNVSILTLLPLLGRGATGVAPQWYLEHPHEACQVLDELDVAALAPHFPLILFLVEKSQCLEVRKKAVSLAGHLPLSYDPIKRLRIVLIEDEFTGVKVQAILSLAYVAEKHPQLVSEVIGIFEVVLDTSNNQVAESLAYPIARQVSRLEHPCVVSLLEKILGNIKLSDEARVIAAQNLIEADPGHPAALEFLLNCASDNQFIPYLRDEAIHSLMATGTGTCARRRQALRRAQQSQDLPASTLIEIEAWMRGGRSCANGLVSDTPTPVERSKVR